MKNYINTWANMIAESCGESVSEASYGDDTESMGSIVRDFGESEQISENNDIPGKRYDWKPDFQFTDEVINDLKSRNLLSLGQTIGILLPINRENGPTAYHYDEVYDHTDPVTKKSVFRPPTIHDNEVFDILHIELSFNVREKSIGIDRYYGHRKDWVLEDHTDKHRDWTEVPPLTKSTVSSIVDAYRRHGVFEKVNDAIDSHVQQLINVRGYHLKHLDKNDPKAVAWVKKYTEIFSNDSRARFLRAFCGDAESGELFKYKYNFFEPEIPTEEYNRKKFEEYKESCDRISSEIIAYYEEADRYGRNTGD